LRFSKASEAVKSTIMKKTVAAFPRKAKAEGVRFENSLNGDASFRI
jgi:hypothetical protein